MDHHLALFDIESYRVRVEPPLANFFAGGSEAAILHLLEETNRLVAADEALRQRLQSRNIEPGQSIIRLLTGQDSIDDHLTVLETPPSRQALERYVSGPVVYELLAILCIPNLPGLNVEQHLGDGAFLSFLREHSAWIENAFTGGLFGKGTRLRFPLGLQSEAIERTDRERLLAELKALPEPDPRAESDRRLSEMGKKVSRLVLTRGSIGMLARAFDVKGGPVDSPGETFAAQLANLKRLLEASLRDPNLTVLLSLG